MSDVPPPKTPPGGFPFAARPASQDPPATAPPPAPPAPGQQGYQQLSIAQLRAAQAAGSPSAPPPPAAAPTAPPGTGPVVKQGQLGSVVIPPWEAPPPGRESRHSGAAQPLPQMPDDTYHAPHMAAPVKEPWFDRGHVILLITAILLTILTTIELLMVGFKIGFQNARQAAEAAQQAQQSEAESTTTGQRRSGGSDSLYPSTKSSRGSTPENEIDRVQRENERRERMDAYSAEREDNTPTYHPANPGGETDTAAAPVTEEPASTSGGGGGFEMATPVPE